MKLFAKIFLFSQLCSMAAWATAPSGALSQSFNFDAVLTDTSGNPINNASTTLRFQILNPAGNCTLYDEQQTLAVTDGKISVKVGSEIGSSKRLGTDMGKDWAQIFQNSTPFPSVSACTGGWTPVIGDERLLRVYVDGTALTPDFSLSAVPSASVAETLQGKSAADLIQVSVPSQLTQTNVENIFSSYSTLAALIGGTSSLYLKAAPTAPVNNNGQRLTNIGAPTTGTDATNKSYVDSQMGGKLIDLQDVGAGTGGGKVLVWDQAQSKWVAQALTATDNTKLPLAGGAMTGPILASSAGLASAPGYAFDSDAATGMYRSGAGTITFSHAGTPSWSVAANAFSVFGGSGPQLNTGSGSATAPTYSFRQDTATGIFSPGAGALVFSTAGLARMAFDVAGGVGLNTVSPAAGATLDLVATGTRSALVVPRETTANRPTGLPGMIRFNTSTGKFEAFEGSWINLVGGDFRSDGSIPLTGSLRIADGTPTNPGLAFNSSTSTGIFAAGGSAIGIATAGATRIVVTPAGNVGVGTSAPAAKLHVGGSIVSKDNIVPSGATADFSLGNTQVLQAVGTSTINLSGLVPGGRYTVIVEDTTSRTYTFTGCTTSYYSPSNTYTAGGTRTIYNIYYISTSSCYIDWQSNFQ